MPEVSRGGRHGVLVAPLFTLFLLLFIVNVASVVGGLVTEWAEDLTLMLFANGSLKKDGVQAQRTFAVNLVPRYQAQYFGHVCS